MRKKFFFELSLDEHGNSFIELSDDRDGSACVVLKDLTGDTAVSNLTPEQIHELRLFLESIDNVRS